MLIGYFLESPRLGALSLTGAAIMIYMAVVAMSICYLTWFIALRRLPPTMATMGMLAVPALGVGFAALLLGESVSGRELGVLLLTFRAC